ncbi:hypothetical protein CBER1_05980 [Cercospora berteroae]|uniref:NmrA-like domain-containing protein n=1 Tax=Cercospora berteroae TaxID=357750 RepID=A0A2S6C4M4_9PEZI|nr:hypothetical protein CBER1_05980 [Cercospora berteroae]
MVAIAIAGASGSVAQEVIDGLVATGKHEILLLSRNRLSYTLFQPGLFPNYFLYPHKHPSSPHFTPFETHIDFANCRALVLSPDGENDKLTLTTLEDLVQVVVRAVDYDGEWPSIGGIKGTEISIGELIKIGERVRGRPFDVEYLQISDLEAGNITSSWLPVIDHPAFTPEQARALAEKLLSGMVLGIHAGALKVSDEWNQLLPDMQFTQAEAFLKQGWEGKA